MSVSRDSHTGIVPATIVNNHETLMCSEGYRTEYTGQVTLNPSRWSEWV